jgi:C-terminal processing protease CtpA/Prc
MNTGKSQNIIGKFIDVVFKEKGLGISLASPRTVDGKGAIVTSIAEKGEAFKAGIIQNDFVQKIGKHIVSKREMGDIQKIIRSEKRPTIIRFVRPGNEFDVEYSQDAFDATLGQSPNTTKPELVVLAVPADGASSKSSVKRMDKIILINKKDVRSLKYDAMIKEIRNANKSKTPTIIRFLRRVNKELAKEAMQNISEQEAKMERDPEPPALSSKPSKSKNEYDVVFKKDKTLDMSFAKNPLGGGAYVTKVKKKGNAYKKKIVVGDIIIGVSGKDVSKHPYDLTKRMLKAEMRPMNIRLKKVSRLSRKPKNKNERDVSLKNPISDCFEWVRPPHGGGAAISEIKAIGMADKLKVTVGDMVIGIEGIDLTAMTFVETVSLIANIEPPVVVRFKSPITLPKRKKKGEVEVTFKGAVTGIRHDHPLMGEGTVIFVVDKDSVGAKAGLVPGDRLIGVNGLSVEDEPLKIVRKIIDRAKPPVTLRYQHSILKKLPRRPRKTEVDITFPKGQSIGFGLQVDVEHHIECVVADVVSGSHAEQQGVKAGYYIVGVSGKDVRASPYEEVIRLLNLSKEKNEHIVIRFHTKPKTADVKGVLQAIREKMEREALSAADVFREIDIDGGGTVSPDEFRQGITLFGFIATDPEFRALMDVLDANGDGEIELHEFEDAINNPEKAAEQADEELANVAETIQAAERGRIARNEFLNKKKNVTKIQALQRGRKVRKEAKAKADQAVKIQAQFRGMKSRRDLDKKLKGIDQEEIKAATKIQAIQRGKNERKKVEKLKQDNDAAVKVQSVIRGSK